MKFEDKNVSPKNYDEYWEKVGIFADDRVKEILSLCPIVRSSVDLGGGSGSLAFKIGAKLVDWSPVAVEQAEKLGVEAVCSNLIDYLDKTDERFELVVLADVLEEMKQSETAILLNGIKKICTKYFVISTPTHENYLNISTHQVIYSADELITMITDLGFKLEKRIPYSDRLIARFLL